MAEPASVTALVFADARALLEVAGLSLVGRQVKQLQRLGVAGIVIVAPPDDLPTLRSVVAREAPGQANLTFVETTGEFALADGAAFLALRGHSLVDRRIMAALQDHPDDRVLVCRPGGDAPELDADQVAAVRAEVSDLEGVEDFNQLVSRLATDALRLPMEQCGPAYEPELRRPQPMLFEIASGEGDAPRLTDLVIARTQKGTLDWPARFIHPPLENFLTRLIARTPVTPNQVSLFVAALGFAAAWFLAQGQWAAGLPLALMVGVLDGVDGKLSRAKLMQTRMGQAEHLLDKAVEYSWYFALAVHFAPLRGDAVWALALLIVGFSAAEAVQGEFFRRLTGRQLDDTGAFERGWRLIAGRRNTFMWTFAACVLLGAAYEGFWLLGLYAVVTFFVAQLRFILRFVAFAKDSSDVMRHNLERSSY